MQVVRVTWDKFLGDTIWIKDGLVILGSQNVGKGGDFIVGKFPCPSDQSIIQQENGRDLHTIYCSKVSTNHPLLLTNSAVICHRG